MLLNRTALLFSLLYGITVLGAKYQQQMKKFTFKGPLASVFTPFRNDTERTLNLDVIPKYSDYLASKNVTGVLVAGTLGEGTSMTIDERKEVAAAWARATKRNDQHLMIQVGGAALKSVKELAAHAEAIDADSLLVLPDLYVKPTSSDDVIDYLEAVSKAAPGTPIIYYESFRLALNIDIGELLSNVGKKVPTFAGIKHVTTDLKELRKSWMARNSYEIFIGTDWSTLAGCTIGMESMITSSVTFVPELSNEVLEFCQSSTDFQRARNAHNRINDIVETIDSYADDTVAMKAATSLVAGLPLGPPRAPLKALSEYNLKSMAMKLLDLGLEISKTSA